MLRRRKATSAENSSIPANSKVDDDSEARSARLAYLKAWAQVGVPGKVRDAVSAPSAKSTIPTASDISAAPTPRVGAVAAVQSLTRAFSLPVVRLRRGETPESLRQAFRDISDYEGGVGTSNGKAHDMVRQPIVVDLTELVSTHITRPSVHGFSPPSLNEIRSLIMTLETLGEPSGKCSGGFKPVGVFAGSAARSSSMAADLGMPMLSPTMNAASVPATTAPTLPSLPHVIGAESQEEKAGRKKEEESASSPSNGVMVHEGSVRSGQQVIAKPGQSLLVYGSVNPGGEVLADGDIFIWGALNGRALAGISPNSSGEETKTLKVVCQRFDAELVAIGSCFATVEQPPHGVHHWKRDMPTTITLAPKSSELDFHSEVPRK